MGTVNHVHDSTNPTEVKARMLAVADSGEGLPYPDLSFQQEPVLQCCDRDWFQALE